MKLLLIDAIGPFFRHYKTKRINWSKIPFRAIETEDGIKPRCLQTIPDDFRAFCARAAALGYTHVTLDDVAHLVPCADYPAPLSSKIEAYRTLYRELFAVAAEHGLGVFLTMDVMFYNAALRRKLGTGWKRAADWLGVELERLLADFPIVSGVIVRFGESDGVDVDGDFRSRLVLKHPHHARGFLLRLLPVFERADRLMLFRTWSVGVHQIGDLIWNERTFNRVFGDIHSPALVISMKYGESDFFRHLPLNRLFFASDHQKIVEFQARREYEGFGGYPSFVGFDCADYLRELSEARNVIGASVWCQTGGWGKLRVLTFLRNSSPWVELNAAVVPRLCRGETCAQAVEAWLRDAGLAVDVEAMMEFLRLSDVVIKDLLYLREFAQRRLFFRRLRLPPQLYVFWDRVIINHTIKRVIKCLVADREAAIEQGHAALDALRQMIALAQAHGIPDRGLEFQLATFEILAAAREYFFRPYDPAVTERIERMKAEYKQRFRRNYSIRINFDETRVPKPHLRWAMALMLRRRHRYRIVDQVVTLRLLSWLYPLVSRTVGRIGPRFAHKQAMGLDALFK